VSTTVITNDALEVLPRLSNDVHVTVVAPSGSMVPGAGLHVTPTTPSTTSSADALKLTAAPAAPVASLENDAGSVSAGAVVSTTVTSNEPLVELPWLSVAPQSTEVVASANADPDDGTQLVATGPSTASVADAVKLTAAPSAPVASAVVLPGSVSDGPVLSATVTTNVDDDELPRVSLDEHAIVLAPRGSTEPDAGTHVAGRLPSTASVAVGSVYVTVAPSALVASIVTFEGVPVRTGPVVSCTVIANEPDAVLPAASVAEQDTTVVPNANVVPDAGVQVTAGDAGSASVAVAV